MTDTDDEDEQQDSGEMIMGMKQIWRASEE